MSSLILVLGAIGALACFAMLGLGIMGRRVPVLGYVGAPLLVLIIASVATMSSAGGTIASLEAADITQLHLVANGGLKDALATNASGRLWASAVLVLAVWCAAIPAVIKSGRDWGWTVVDAVFAIILLIGGAVATLVLGTKWGVASQMMPVLGVMGVGGVGVAVASLRRGLFEDAERVAALRFTAGIAFIAAVGQIGQYAMAATEVEVLEKALTASPDSLDTTMIVGLETLSRVTNLAWLTWGFGFLIGLCGLFMELGEAVQKYLVIDAAAITALAAVMLVTRGLERSAINDVREVGNLAPLTELIDAMGIELPASAIAMKGALVDARASEGGFGDVLVLEKSVPAEGAEPVTQWIRRYKWNGGGWDADETPLAQAQLTARPVLLAASGSMQSQYLFEAIEKAPAGASLLVRMGEIQNDIPAMAKQRNGALLPLTVSTQADPTNQIWARADKRGLYYGPIRWYGTGDEEKDLIARADSAFEQTESAGITLLINERSMVRQVVDYCLAGTMTAQDESVVAREGVWCELSQETFEDFRATAADGWEAPKPEGLKLSMTVDKRLPEGIGQLLENELGAMAFCQQKAVDFGEEEGLSGRYAASFEVTQKGKIGWHENAEAPRRSRTPELENRVVRKCVRKRMDTIVWPEHEVETDPEKEDDYTTIEYTIVFGDPPPPSEDLELDLEEEEEE
ncbi:MAG: hypothetical protein KC912_05950 [Proteobacteria bacterium]|nr:hypothetical protein [Pseudomonadota bacterium]